MYGMISYLNWSEREKPFCDLQDILTLATEYSTNRIHRHAKILCLYQTGS